MTHTSNTAASSAPTRTIPSVSPGDAAPETREDRARTEPMTIRPLRDRRYVVETEGGTYVVALDAGSCTCPDHAIRGSHCKHLRRVAMEVADGALPAPDERVGVCAVCGTETFVPFQATGPQLCVTHRPAPGDAVRDRETGKLLIVTEVTAERADSRETADGRRISEFESNANYGGQEPVIEAVYVESLDPEAAVRDATRYGFPASRLVSIRDGLSRRNDADERDGSTEFGGADERDEPASRDSDPAAAL